MARRTRKAPYKSGYCMYAPHQHPCKGEFENGPAIKPRMTLCSCACHGNYQDRLIEAGQVMPVLIDEDEEDDE